MNKIFVEAKNLINSNGNVWLWKSETMDGVRHFLTNDDAQKYIELHHQFSRDNGGKEESYSIGMEADFMAAAQKFERKKKANEVKAYCKHVDALIECNKSEIKALDGLIEVCWRFDGKVLNKRFHEAVKEATGYSSSFTVYCFDMVFSDYREKRRNIKIRADWTHGWSITGKKNEIDPTYWQWCTGERLEAGKAVAVIAYEKNYRLQVIQELSNTKKQYAAYLKLARKAEHIFKELKGYDYSMRMYAKERDLNQYLSLTDIWHTY